MTGDYTPTTGGPTIHPCPSCGHCPTCGRGGHQTIHVWNPYYPYAPTIWGTSGTGNATTIDYTTSSHNS